MAESALRAVGLFAVTNIDDIVVLTVLFLSVQRGSLALHQVVVGQYAGLAALVALSGLVAAGAASFPEKWIGLLGLVPIAIGVRAFLNARREEVDSGDESVLAVRGTLGVAALTVANGADNIAIYAPVFATMDAKDFSVTVAVFAVMTAVWLVVGRLIGSHPRTVRTISRVERWLVPAIFCALGALIVLESGLIGSL